MLLKRRLPPMNALRVFEVAARYENFTLAANELNVTQTAVSKQVAQLEAYLGQPLFLRNHKSLKLTESGRICAQSITQSLDHIEKKLLSLDSSKPYRVTILADVDFARLWMFPLLPKLEQRHPDIQISLVTKNYTQPIDADEEFDLAISWGQGNWKNLTYEPLFTNQVFPVCSPSFFGSNAPDMSQVKTSQLIHDRDTYWWHTFLDRFKIDSIDADNGRFFSQTALCLDAAVRGDGITIGDEVSTRTYLENGSLIVPFQDSLLSPNSYYMLTPGRRGITNDSISHIITWLAEEAVKHQQWYLKFWASRPWASSPS